MIELLLATSLAVWPTWTPQPQRVVDDHVWSIHSDGGCPRAIYSGRIAGTVQTFEMTHCGDWSLTVVSHYAQAAKAGLIPGDVIFSGNYNEELNGPEGRLELPDRCGPISIDTAPTLSRPWPLFDPGRTITFALPLATCPGEAGGAAPYYEGALVLRRVDEVSSDPNIVPAPAQGCADWRITSDGNQGFEARVVRVCFDGSTLTGTVGDKRVLEGVIWGLDGSIEAAYTPPASEGCETRPYRVTGTQLPRATFELEGFAPVLGEDCTLEGYNDVRLHFEPAET